MRLTVSILATLVLALPVEGLLALAAECACAVEASAGCCARTETPPTPSLEKHCCCEVEAPERDRVPAPASEPSLTSRDEEPASLPSLFLTQPPAANTVHSAARAPRVPCAQPPPRLTHCQWRL